MYDVVLVYLNIFNGYLTGAEYQLDCGYIGSYLLKNRKRVCQYINKNLSSVRNLVYDLDENYKSNNYCFYINEYNYYISKIVINNLKKINRSCNVLIAGPSAEYIGKFLLDEVDIDYCITYASAITLDRILNDQKKQTIPNIIYREEKEIHSTANVFFDYTLDDLGHPYQSGMIPPEEIQNVGMTTSIGCYGNCSFCSYKKESKLFKTHSIESVLYEISYISHYIKGSNVRINFLDDCFSVNPARTYDLCMNLKKQSYRFCYWCCTRADLLNEAIIDLMRECNFKGVVIGLESASTRVFEKIGKIEVGSNAAQYLDRIAKLYKYGKEKGINPCVSANFGLPFEEYDDVQKTLKYLSHNSMVENVSVCFTTAFPGSRLFDNNYMFDTKIAPSPYKLPFRTEYKEYMKAVCYQLDTFRYKDQNREWEKIIVEVFSGVSFKDALNKNDCIDYIFADTISTEIFEIINNYVSVNGYIFVEADKLEFKNHLYSENRKTLCMTLKQYDSIMLQAYEKNYYLPNIVFYHIVGSNIYFQPNATYIPQKGKVKFREIESIDDFKELYDEAKKFYSTRVIMVKNLQRGFILDSCRWIRDMCNRKCCLHNKSDIFKSFDGDKYINSSKNCISCRKAYASVPEVSEYIKVISWLHINCDVSNYAEYKGIKVDTNMRFTVL